MKRKHIQKYHSGIYRHFTLFSWTRCCICGQDFRREFGFRFMAGPYFFGCGVWYYLCPDCAPNKNIANEIAVNHKYKKDNLCPPPPPPLSINKKRG